jgi:ubiquinone/menaquinone biosynthesis C-methylase UbiE
MVLNWRLHTLVKEANRRVFDRKDFQEYQNNTSIFDPQRQNEIHKIITRYLPPAKGSLLDIGCGTGNILRIARKYFKECYGIDLSMKLLCELHHRHKEPHLSVADALYLPYRNSCFDMVTAYGVFHHIVEHETLIKEIYRVLRPNGIFYMDHDPNFFFGRFYHIYYRVRYLLRPGFGTQDAELSEYHNTRSGGINPLDLQKRLTKAGFAHTEVHFRITSNLGLPIYHRLIIQLLRYITKVWPLRSCYTHFWIVAKKKDA